ncbi:hypothetical protein CIK05_11885 [Bdellovibrio sp. qaytius]|nr:hypothetical protein CIK05_11885 [Bdellovibrio sp. qaytius]
MERNNQITRILRVIHHLEVNPRGLTAKQIKEFLRDDGYEITVDTIYRDLKALQGAGIPITNEGENAGQWKLEPYAQISKSVSFSAKDLISLFIAQESITHLQGSPVYTDIKAFFGKLHTLLKIKDFDALNEYKGIFGFKFKASWHSGVSQEVLDTVHSACAEKQLLKVSYKSNYQDKPNEYKERILGPEKIYFADSSAYLIAVDQNDQTTKTYSLARIQSVEMLDQEYTPKELNLENYFKHSFGVLNTGEVQKVEISIREPLASYISERRWHDSQVLVRHADGIHLTMEVRLNDEFARWVLSLSPYFEIKKPQALSDRVLELMEINLKNMNLKKAA